MQTKLFKRFIKEAEERFKNKPEVLKVLEEMKAQTSQESRIYGTLLTTALCMDKVV